MLSIVNLNLIKVSSERERQEERESLGATCKKSTLTLQLGHAVAYLVEALSYKPEGSGFDSQ
jgi:hypothetical protein